MRNVNWTRILTILLVILAAFALLYIAGVVLGRFRHAILLFVLGAMTAYVLSPLVNRLELALRVRWLAILVSYVSLAAVLASVGVLLFQPFILQSQSLVDNLHTPTSGSLQSIVRLECRAKQVQVDLHPTSAQSTCGSVVLAPGRAANTPADINRLQQALIDVRNGTISGHLHGHRSKEHPGAIRQPPNPEPQTSVPPSYIEPIQTQVTDLLSNYAQASAIGLQSDPSDLFQAVKHAKRIQSLARSMFQVMSGTPILLLRSQTWLDEHGLHVDVHSKFGQAANQISNQGSLLLNNAVTILQATANTLLNLALILIIAFYFLSDGRRIVHGAMDLVPARYREQVWFFVGSLDGVLGGYIRGQLFLSALAGVLGGAGAAALGVPYPLLIGILTFLLESIPVIGPLIALIPAVAVSLFFMPVITTILLLAWNMIFQQLVTNILGPRIMGIAVGIHPLEAMAAVLVGYPVAGFLGAFLAVPVAGILHIVIRELYGYLAHGRSLPTAGAVPLPPPDTAPSPVDPKARRAAG